jgi:hypothetical protein
VESEQPGTEINHYQEQQRLRKQPFNKSLLKGAFFVGVNKKIILRRSEG